MTPLRVLPDDQKTPIAVISIARFLHVDLGRSSSSCLSLGVCCG